MEIINFDEGHLPDTHQILVQVTARDLKRIMQRVVRLTLQEERSRVKNNKDGTRKI